MAGSRLLIVAEAWLPLGRQGAVVRIRTLAGVRRSADSEVTDGVEVIQRAGTSPLSQLLIRLDGLPAPLAWLWPSN